MFHFFYSIYNLFAQFFDMKAVDMWNLVIYVVVTSGGAVLNYSLHWRTKHQQTKIYN